MPGSPRHWLLTASLLGILGAPMPVFAQAGRTWIDPPAESGAKSSSPVPAPVVQPPQVSVPTPSPPQQSSAPASTQVSKEKESTAVHIPSVASPRGETAGDQFKDKTATHRKVRQSSQQARTVTRSQRREEQGTRRREPRVEVSQARPPRNGLERRARITRYGSVQEGIDAGLEVMRLRTIQLPDGRRIEVLTRPNQDIASELPDGY